ncbi:MAG: hypothetical protein ACE5HE_01305 [Phycisphaerae bacterium]
MVVANDYKKWCPILGLLSVGVLAFGLALRGAPASDDTSANAERAKPVREREVAASSAPTPAASATVVHVDDVVLPTADVEAPKKYRPGALEKRKPRAPFHMRVKSRMGYAPTPIPIGRTTAAVGDPCSCDSDCASLTTDGGCQLAQCIRADNDLGADNDDGTCQVITQDPETRCETDGNPCTIGRCTADGTCDDGPSMASPCPKECTGSGADVGQNCSVDSQCTSDGTVCDNKPRVTCVVDDNGTPGDTSDDRANCRVDGADDQFGRCCDASGNGTYTTQADCPAGSQWLELTDPDDELHMPVRCPGYSSGIVAGNTANDANVIYPIVPPPRQCSMHPPTDNFGALCEVDADCAHRCTGDNLTICQSNADCDAAQGGPGGTCGPDVCISALDADVTDPPDGGRCPGNYMIGDDYLLDIPAGKALRLQEIRFRGGVELQHEVIWFDFYDNSSWRCQGGADHGNSCSAFGDAECSSGKCRPVRAGSTGVRLAQGGIFTYTIERDCDPNCDPTQWCTGGDFDQCECLPRGEGCIADPPFVIPRDGWMVMRAGRETLTSFGPDDLNGSWVPVDLPPSRAGIEVGTNNPEWMWVDDGPKGATDAAPLPSGARVLAFELVGRVIDAPIGSCCDARTGDCQDTQEWDCRFCSGQGAEGQIRKVCDRGGGNWSGIDRDCPDRADECLRSDWGGPRTKDDFDAPTCHGGVNDGAPCVDSVTDCGAPGICYGGQRCGLPDTPCSGGACCSTDGTCASSETMVPADCPDSHCRKNPTLVCVDDAGCQIGPNDFGPCVPDWLGFGTDCGTNCCPQPVDAFGECCRDEYRCTGGVGVACDPADPPSWPPDCGGCELACPGPIIMDIPVPPLIPPGQATVVDFTSDSRAAMDNPADACAGTFNDGWFMSFHVSECANVTWTFCCTDPQLQLVSTVLVEGCPCSGPTTLILPNDGRSGYGDGCGNGRCCADGNYSVQWTVRAGTYHYTQVAGTYCEQTAFGCVTASDCPPGERCISWKMPFQGHLYIEPCSPAACCTGDVCTFAPKFDCEDAGGDWLGDLIPNPIADCAFAPCSDGACCLPDGSCDDQGGNRIDPTSCAALNGDYHGGVTCANQPCAVCDFEDQAHCQLDTGIYIFPSDRNQGVRAADDFRPQDSPIRRVCFNFGFITEDPPPECSDDPPRDAFEIHFYEDAFGVPGTRLVDSPGPVNVDRAEPIPSFRTWNFSAPVGGATGVAVTPGECYWIEITGGGDAHCSTLWTHSVDGNNYRMRDDNASYGYEDIRDSDVVFCIDAGIVVPTQPGINGGCGNIPVACCMRDQTCVQTGFRECSDLAGYGIPYGTCGVTPCPFPQNDLCHIEETPSNPDRPPTGAFEICTGDPAHPELGSWTYYDGSDANNRLGQCAAWPGDAGFGEICHPLAQDCGDPPNDPPGSNPCFPHQFEAYECYATTDNRLAGTDGPDAGGDCSSSGPTSMQADVWYKVTAPCRGEAVITMCGAPSEYDAMLAVFGDHSANPRCPTTGGDNGDLLVCNDDYCTGSGTVSGVQWTTSEGGVYILRMGGWSADGTVIDAGQGISEMHVGFLCDEPILFNPPGVPSNPAHQATKHRYISIDATTNLPQQVALKVRVAEMRRCTGDPRRSCLVDADCRKACQNDLDAFCGSSAQCGGDPCIETGPCVDMAPTNPPLSWFVQAPVQAPSGGDCRIGCGPEDWMARLGPTPHVEDWAPYATLHIGDCQIVPCVTYEVLACDSLDPSICGDPLTIATQVMPFQTPRNYGDVAGPVTPTLEFTPPDGFMNVVDIQAWQLTNQNWGTPNKPQTHPTWVDLHGGGTGIPPNYIINVTDLNALKFTQTPAWPWPNSLGGLDPQDCP